MKNVVVIGGGVAGLSAALLLARSLRTVSIIDGSNSRNSLAKEVHNLLGREGINPMELLAVGKNEIGQYPWVEIIYANAISVKQLSYGFKITLECGIEVLGEKLLLATGIRDRLPSIPGMQKFWSKNIFNCPYCHGYEVKDEPLAIYSSNPQDAYDFVLTIYNWSKNLILLTDGKKVLTEQQSEHLMKLGVQIKGQRISHFHGKPGHNLQIKLEDGMTIERRGLFMRTQIEQQANFLKDLGCEISDLGFVKVDSSQRTTIPGIFAAGDMVGGFQQISTAIAQGATAGAMINHELIRALKSS
jgi:thioredoxin reductase